MYLSGEEREHMNERTPSNWIIVVYCVVTGAVLTATGAMCRMTIRMIEIIGWQASGFPWIYLVLSVLGVVGSAWYIRDLFKTLRGDARRREGFPIQQAKQK